MLGRLGPIGPDPEQAPRDVQQGVAPAADHPSDRVLASDLVATLELALLVQSLAENADADRQFLGLGPHRLCRLVSH